MTFPPGAHSSSRTPTPSTGHVAVIVVTVAIAAGLILGSTAAPDALLALLVLLLGCFTLVIPVSLLTGIWRPARPPLRVLLGLAALACLLLLAFGVVRVLELAPTVF